MTVKKIWSYIGAISATAALASAAHSAVLLQEGFEDVAGLGGAGWVTTNASTPVGATNWFQGNVAPFPAQAGTPNSYAAANYLSTSPAGGEISTWLITPTLALSEGMAIIFWTRTDEDIDGLFSDRLNVRASTSGASTSLADFSNIVLSVNPALVPGTGYPSEWTQYVAVLTGVGAGATGRIAFEYSVPAMDATGAPVFANYIGVDSVTVLPLPAHLWLLLGGVFAMTFALRQGRAQRTLSN
jgi:hypothetical protein